MQNVSSNSSISICSTDSTWSPNSSNSESNSSFINDNNIEEPRMGFYPQQSVHKFTTPIRHTSETLPLCPGAPARRDSSFSRLYRNGKLKIADHDEEPISSQSSSSGDEERKHISSGVILLQGKKICTCYILYLVYIFLHLDIPIELRRLFDLRCQSDIFKSRLHVHHDGSWGVISNMYWLEWVMGGITQKFEWEEEIKEGGIALYTAKNIKWGTL